MITQQKERPRFEGGAEQAQLRRNQVIAVSGTNLLVGVWLICAPFALSYSGVSNALWNDIILGATIATLAGLRVLGAYRQTWLSWTLEANRPNSLFVELAMAVEPRAVSPRSRWEDRFSSGRR